MLNCMRLQLHMSTNDLHCRNGMMEDKLILHYIFLPFFFNFPINILRKTYSGVCAYVHTNSIKGVGTPFKLLHKGAENLESDLRKGLH